MEAGGSHLQGTTEEERIADWTQDLREIRRMVEFLAHRERKLDVKAEVRRLQRLEKERSQLEDEEHEASLLGAFADRTKVVKLVVDKWFVNKGFGFGQVPTGEVVFILASVVRGAALLTSGTDAWVQVVHDDARAQGGHRACKAWRHAAWKAERDKERASRVAQASKASSGINGRAGSKVGEGSLQGVHDEPGKAGNDASLATSSPFSLAPSDSSLPRGKGFTNLEGPFRGAQPRTATRAQEVAAVIGETLSFYVKATGNHESSMR